MKKEGGRAPAYLTVYLALLLGSLVTLCLVLVEGARISTIQMEATCIADIGMDDVMAEYHRELFSRYNLLALDSSYGTKTVGRVNLEGRLAWYLDKNLERKWSEGYAAYVKKDYLRLRLDYAKMEDFSLLSDWNGGIFRRQATEAVRDDLGITAALETQKWLKKVEEYRLDSWDVEADKRAADERIADAWRETEEEIPFDNPTAGVEEVKKKGILWLVMGDRPVSGKRTDPSILIWQRIREGKRNHGTIVPRELSALQKAEEKLLFEEYLTSYFGHCLDVREDCALNYELEYVLVGDSTDAGNLRGVLYRLLAIREAANATYLFSDEKKCKEAGAVALVLSVLAGKPEIKEPLKTSILLAWAYAEAIHDLKVLMKGGRIALIKDEKSWHYDLDGILKGLWDGDVKKEEEGLTYGEYLRILIALTNEDELTGRAMDVVEANVRLTPGNRTFRMDACFARIQARIGIVSDHGYRTEIREDKRY